MSRKSSTTSTKKESRFIGDSKDLKMYLLQKKEMYRELLKGTKDKLYIKRIKERISLIEDMLDQKYFTEDEVYSMNELVEAIKRERADLYIEYKSMEPDLADAKKLAYDAFNTSGGYLANSYEKELYNSRQQVELRELIDEYQALEWEYEGLVKCWKVLWKLLGVINRPIGFFEKL